MTSFWWLGPYGRAGPPSSRPDETTHGRETLLVRCAFLVSELNLIDIGDGNRTSVLRHSHNLVRDLGRLRPTLGAVLHRPTSIAQLWIDEHASVLLGLSADPIHGPHLPEKGVKTGQVTSHPPAQAYSSTPSWRT
jgi:hypothetical protein